MELTKAYDPKRVEHKIYKRWEKSGFFNPDKLPGRNRKSFTIVLPPPNITGNLHMGHALNAVIQDILIRRKRMQGYKTLWLPGTDHAGIAAQNVVEKELKKEGLTRFDLGREKFLERMWQWKEKYGSTILGQLKKMGASCDWSRTRFTMDKDYSRAVETAFWHYYKKGWIYKAKRVINWCPRCRTSLSDLELEYKEEKGKLWFIKYPLANPKSKISKIKKNTKYIVAATTRPETMLGDTAVAVHPNDKRYKSLLGTKVELPLTDKLIPIVADRLVDPRFGTGAVKVTPAHDLNDYEISLRHDLELRKVIDERGKITSEAPLAYQNLTAIEARQRISEDLEKLGLLEKIEDYIHQVPLCYRCLTVIEFIPSEQWFLKMDELAKMAVKAVKTGKVRFIPKRWEKIYIEWLENVRDWCISRQLWWGHTLPIWQCQIGKNSKFKTQNSKLRNGYFISLKNPENCPVCKRCQPRQVDDVLDTWFSSALWPFAALGWPRLRQGYGGPSRNKKSDLQRFYPTDVLSTDRGIINLWVARMIFSGMEFMGKEPFKDVYVHATVLTKEGKRMSKSLGTGIDPLELINKYGADAARFGIAWQISELQDIRFSEENIVMGKKFCNKIWNASRFVLGRIGESSVGLRLSSSVLSSLPKGSAESPLAKEGRPNPKTPADKKILRALDATIKSVNRDIERYQFGRAAQTLYHFFWHDFCDKYIEVAKWQIANQSTQKNLSARPSTNKVSALVQQENTKKILFHVLLTSLKLLHPFIPFITEEIYQQLPMKNKKKCLMIEEWPTS